MPRAGILAGLPSEQMVGGNVFDRVGRDVATQAGIEQRQQGLDIAASQEGRQQEKFALEKQLHPTALRLAQQQVEQNELKFKEATDLAENKEKIGTLLNETFAGLKAGTLKAEDLAIAGINMSRLAGNYQGAAGALSDYGKIIRGEEEGKAISDFISNEGARIGEAMQDPSNAQAQLAVIQAATRYPKAFNSSTVKGFIKQATDHLEKSLPPAVADTLKLYIAEAATVPDAPGKKAIWDKLMADNPDAATLFQQNPTWVPPDVEAGRKERAEAAKAKVSKEGALAVAEVTGKLGIERERVHQTGAEKVARIGAESREKVQESRNRAAVEKMNQTRTVKDAAVLVTTTQRELAALMNQAEKKMVSDEEKAVIRDKITAKEDELRAYKQHYSRLIASGGKAGELDLGEVEGIKPERLSAMRPEIKRAPPDKRLGFIGYLVNQNKISVQEAEVLRDEVQRGMLK